MSKKVDPARASVFVTEQWEQRIVPTLREYIRIPNKSPMFDGNWLAHGHMGRAISLFKDWCQNNAPIGMKLDILQEHGRTPLLWIEIPGTTDETVLLYGHLDKQPEMDGWMDGFGPWTPVVQGDRLYGRGAADDGYAMFAAITAVRVLQEQHVPHARCIILIESCEESGSYDLPFYMQHLAERIGNPSLVVCLDSGCGNYEQLWSTTSLRGIVTGTLSVELVKEGVHSGDASGVVASSFRVIRTLLSRLENETTGAIKPEVCWARIPEQRVAQARQVAEVLGSEVYDTFPLWEGVRPIADDPAELILNRTWRPALSVTGVEGIPSIADGGNVLRPKTQLKLSLRLPPVVCASTVVSFLEELLEKDPPYGAKVRFLCGEGATGWDAPPLAGWVNSALQSASQSYFGKRAMYMGEGGSIPFMGMLGKQFPDTQFVITGVLGPHSNAHGPNEFLHLPTARKVTCCVAEVLAAHCQNICNDYPV